MYLHDYIKAKRATQCNTIKLIYNHYIALMCTVSRLATKSKKKYFHILNLCNITLANNVLPCKTK